MELTVREFAKRLGVTPGRVRQLVVEGRIKPRYLNPRMMLIDEKQLHTPALTDQRRKPKRTVQRESKKNSRSRN
jgi:excisionase family DNA binding protein